MGPSDILLLRGYCDYGLETHSDIRLETRIQAASVGGLQLLVYEEYEAQLIAGLAT
jgi:hypothetical protein